MDEPKHLTDFFQFLVAEKLWTGIVSDIKILREIDESSWFDADHGFQNADYYDRIEFDLLRTFYLLQGASIFEERILKQFHLPPVTKTELWELARTHLSGMHTLDEIESAKVRFVAHAAQIANYRNEGMECTSDIHVGLGRTPRNDYEAIWESNYGFRLAFVPSENAFSDAKIVAFAAMSKGACEELELLLKRVVPSAAKSIQLQFADVAISVPSDFPSDSRQIPFDFDEDAAVNEYCMEANLFKDFLDAYFEEPSKKTGTFEQRLRNAAHLLVEADSQPNNAIGLALNLTAIEALVCEKTEGIVDELSRHVSTLLESDAMERPNSIKAIKDLYDRRSKTLHGDRVDGDLDARWRSRALATAVFKAAVDWKRHRQSTNSGIDRGSFISELRVNSTTGLKFEGVPHGLNRFIPTEKNRTPKLDEESDAI